MSPPKLLDQVRTVARVKHFSRKTEDAYASWIKRFILFNRKRHPIEMAENEIRQFLAHPAVNLKVSSSTQTVALRPSYSCTLIYTHVLNRGGRGVRSPLDF